MMQYTVKQVNCQEQKKMQEITNGLNSKEQQMPKHWQNTEKREQLLSICMI